MDELRSTLRDEHCCFLQAGFLFWRQILTPRAGLPHHIRFAPFLCRGSRHLLAVNRYLMGSQKGCHFSLQPQTDLCQQMSSMLHPHCRGRA